MYNSINRDEVQKHLDFWAGFQNNFEPHLLMGRGIRPGMPEYNADTYIQLYTSQDIKMSNYGETWSYISKMINNYNVTLNAFKILGKLQHREYAEKIYFCSDASFRNNVLVGGVVPYRDGYKYDIEIRIHSSIRDSAPETPIKRMEWIKDNFDKIYCIFPNFEDAIRYYEIFDRMDRMI